jgi:hypothetical protein
MHMHTLVKFPQGHEQEQGDDDALKEFKHDGLHRKWHLVVDLNDGEFTACGLATPEYPTETKQVTKGGVTCIDCLETIKFFKNVKL